MFWRGIWEIAQELLGTPGARWPQSVSRRGLQRSVRVQARSSEVGPCPGISDYWNKRSEARTISRPSASVCSVSSIKPLALRMSM